MAKKGGCKPFRIFPKRQQTKIQALFLVIGKARAGRSFLGWTSEKERSTACALVLTPTKGTDFPDVKIFVSSLAPKVIELPSIDLVPREKNEPLRQHPSRISCPISGLPSQRRDGGSVLL